MHIVDWNKLVNKLQFRGTRVPTEGSGRHRCGGEGCGEEELFRVGLNLTLNVIYFLAVCTNFRHRSNDISVAGNSLSTQIWFINSVS